MAPRAPALVRSAVIGGERSSVEYDGVVMIGLDSEDGSWADCTATLVSPWILMTAKHCVALVEPGEFVCSGDGELLDKGTGAGTFGAVAPPETLNVYVGVAPQQPVTRGAAIFASGSDQACRDDVAAVVLERPIDWVPVVPIRPEVSVRVGELFTLMGYGAHQDSTEIERRGRRGIRVLDVGALSSADTHPNPTSPPRTFAVGGGTVCVGDSGGPALDEDGHLVGIYSRISGDCDAEESRNTYMVAPSFLELVERAQSALEAQGIAAEPEGFAGASGEPAIAEPTASVLEDDTPAKRSASPATSDALRCQATVGSSSEAPTMSVVGWWCALGLLLRRRRACADAECQGVPGD